MTDDPSFTSERRRVIQEEQAKCVSSANDPSCIVSLTRMDAEAPQRECTHCGTTHVGTPPAGFRPHCGMCGGRMQKNNVQGVIETLARAGVIVHTVSLPNTSEQEPAQLEETQAEDEPPPSGWRDRPALL
jgi:hypothetical protein